MYSDFTFQYVSINTDVFSTSDHPFDIFTFQYVSINTDNDGFGSLDEVFFTFQYVSINTVVSNHVICEADNLYIPICFY